MESLQRLLASSWSAKLLAVRKVAQENDGRKTPGIDGVVSTSDEDRVDLLKDGLSLRGLSPASLYVGSSSRRPTASCGPWASRCAVHTAPLHKEVRDSGGRARPRRNPIDQAPDRRDQQRRIGWRSSVMISGVSRIHRGPWGADWTPSRRPERHQAAIVETFTFNSAAATWAVQRPSPR